jgi:hypothetical protein
MRVRAAQMRMILIRIRERRGQMRIILIWPGPGILAIAKLADLAGS